MNNYLKRIILSLLFIISCVSTGFAAERKLQPKPYCDPCINKDHPGIGLYVGGQIGEQKAEYSIYQVRNIGQLNQADSIFGLNARGVTGGPLIGYGFEGGPLQLYWGIEAEVLFGNTDAKGSIDITSDGENVQHPRIKTTTAYGAALRIGKNICGALIYTRFGVESRRFHVSFENRTGGLTVPETQIFFRKHQVGFVPGIGIDLPLMAGVSGRFEVREAFYDGKNASSPTNPTNPTKISWRKPTIFTVLLGFTYRTGLLEVK